MRRMHGNMTKYAGGKPSQFKVKLEVFEACHFHASLMQSEEKEGNASSPTWLFEREYNPYLLNIE